MKAVETSLCYRYIRALYAWSGRVAHESLTGRALSSLTRGVGPVVADSRFFGTGRIASATADDGSLPLAVSALARPAAALQISVATRRSGPGLRTVNEAARSSAFSNGEWVRLIGAGVLGLGIGLLADRLGPSVVLILAGLVLTLAGPAIPTALRAARMRRMGRTAPMTKLGRPTLLSGAPAHSPGLGLGRVRGSTWAAMAMCATAGVLTGASPGDRGNTLLVFVGVVAAAAGLLYRPEAILVVIAAFPWVDWVARTTLGGLGPAWDDALLAVSLALLIWSVLVLGRAQLRTVPIALPVLAMLAAAVGSMVVRGVPADVGLYALRVLFAPILFYFVGFLLPKNMLWVRRTIGAFVVSCTALAFHGLYQYVTHAPMPADWIDLSETGIATRAYSVVTSPNILGALLAMGALMAASLALSHAFRGTRRLLVAGACLVQLAGLAVTFSRGAWLGFAAGLLAMVVLGYRHYLLAVLGAAMVAWFAGPRVFVERLLFAFSTAYAQKSVTGLGRLYRWDVALNHIADHPFFGLGLGTFGGTTAYLFGYWSLWVDNFYLQMAAEGGLLLLVFFLWLLLRGGKGLVRGHRIAGDPFIRAVTAGTFGAFLALMVANFVEADWETMSVGVEFWFLAGLATSAALTMPAAQTDER